MSGFTLFNCSNQSIPLSAVNTISKLFSVLKAIFMVFLRSLWSSAIAIFILRIVSRFNITQSLFIAGGFGSCHCFGVAVECAAMVSAKSVGENFYGCRAVGQT